MKYRVLLVAVASALSAACGAENGDIPDGDLDSENGTDSDTAEDTVLLIDDCDDGDNQNELSGMWLSYDDGHDPGGGLSTVEPESWFKSGEFTMSAPGVGDTGYAARIQGTTAAKLGYDYVGLVASLGPHSYCPDPKPADIDVASYTGIQFSAKGTVSGGPLAVKILHSKEGVEDNCTENGLTGDTLTSWMDYAADITDRLTKEWREIRINFRKDFVGPASVDIETVLAHAKDIHFFFQTTDGGTVDLTVDNLALYRDTEEVVDSETSPDMIIHEPDPPEEDTLDDIEIEHPLQAVAETYLNNGYNLTNWLEQNAFDGFGNYTETFVENLAAAGFKALRLPIDLDRFIANRTEYFEGDADLEVDPTLFTVLDAFDEWTLAHGLSLTIDYHQYDRSLDLTDTRCIDAAVTLWAAIAEHFADNPRPDLFYELLNEVEQSGGTDQVNAGLLTTVAEQLIEGIRAFDAERPILFGDVAWYGIDTLVRRDPFADDNIIYVFHFYEPFIFTHQGTSWTDLARTHDIPYPYSADRWVESYSDIGIDPSVQPEWILSQVNTYYQNGNPAALYNRVVKAKRWAVEHNVPLICNEFGAFDAVSETEDRVEYYKDLIDIFEALKIPWQHWFMIMDPVTGEISADMKEAFGLD